MIEKIMEQLKERGRFATPEEVDKFFLDSLRAVYESGREKAKKDLLKIADEGEYEDMRREVEEYFGKTTERS